MRRAGRKSRPYSNSEIRSLLCVRCGSPALTQWRVCADDNTWRPICWPCDVELNRMVLEWMRDPGVESKVWVYSNTPQ